MVFELAGLFFAALLAATLLPAQSELFLAALATSDRYSWPVLLCIATLGNVIGSCFNWWLGRETSRFETRRWFPFSAAAMGAGRKCYARYGWPSLFLSWVPIVGDPLTFAAGVMREPILRFILVVTLAKGLRYVAVIAAARLIF